MKKFIIAFISLCFACSICACSDEQTIFDNTDIAETMSPYLSISDVLVAGNFEFSILSASLESSLTNQLGVKYTPSSGNQFIFVVLSAKNISDEAMNVMNTNFNSYTDNTKITVKGIAGEIDGYMPLLGAVSSGMTFKGYAVWEVPADWECFSFSYIDALTGSDSDMYQLFYEDIADS